MRTKEEVERILKDLDNHIIKESEYYGKMLKWPNNPFVYGFVIGLSDNYYFDLGTNLRATRITKEQKLEFVYDGKPPFEPEIVIQRLRFAVECFKDYVYETIKWNSEHYARLVATNEAVSYQIKKLRFSGDGRNKVAEATYDEYLRESQIKSSEKQIEDSNAQQRLITPASPLLFKALQKNIKPSIKITHEELLKACLDKIKELYMPKNKNPLTCFISYAWGNEYTKLVQDYLVNYVRRAGFTVPFDLDHGAGKESMPKFLDNINKVDFIVIVGTNKLLEKYNWEPSYTGEIPPVVQSELIRICHLAESGHSHKIRCLLAEGNVDESLPPALRSFVRIENFKCGQENYFDGVLELVKSLYEIPQKELEALIEASERECNYEKSETPQCVIC